MRHPIHLTFEAMVALLGRTCERLPDTRNPARVTYSMRDAAMSAFAMFFFQDPSMLAFQRCLETRFGRNNLHTMFGVEAIPSDTQVREILDGAPVEAPRRMLGQVFERYRRSGWAVEFKTSREVGGGLYPMVIDATDHYASSAICCKHCLTRTHTNKRGETTTSYRHTMLSATIIKPRSHRILPLDAEAVANSDGSLKQDCELNAAKRLLPRVRREHPRLPILLLGDAIYAHEPLLADLGPLRMRYLLVVKPGSQPVTFESVEKQEQMAGRVEHGSWSEGPLATRRYFEYRFCQKVPVSQAQEAWATLLEVWERDKAGKVVYHNSWITDLEVTSGNVAEVFWTARGRWKIENEQFNAHKRGGYELEHNFGHGKETLSTLFYFLNLLAFVAHQVLERSDARYQRCRAQAPLKELWMGLRVMVGLAVYETWGALLEHRLWSQQRGP